MLCGIYLPRDLSVSTTVFFLAQLVLPRSNNQFPRRDFSHLPAKGPRPEFAKGNSEGISIGGPIPYVEVPPAGSTVSRSTTVRPYKLLLCSFLAQDN